jgi:branched-chain amino acid transport system ATP-binding protein
MTTTVSEPRLEARTEDPVFAIRNIVAGYGRVVVVRDVTLEFPEGSVTAILGPNGAGKTTCLRVAAGLLRPQEGTVWYQGRDVGRLRPSRRVRAGICLVPEGRGIFRSLTVRENLDLQVPRWSTDRSIDRALASFPVLGRNQSRLAGTLSGGEQQMLALSRAYLSGAKVLLLDEVSMGLAPIIVQQVFLQLSELAATDMTVVIVEQYIAQALALAERVYILDRGSVIHSGIARDLTEEAVMEHYLGGEAAT